MSPVARADGTAPIPDLEAFDGPVIPAADWPAINVADRRVGVMVTGPQAVRLVPELVERATVVKVFQRHAGPVLPSAPLARRVQGLPRIADRLGRWHLRLAVRDKEMRRQLAPTVDAPAAISSRWFRALAQPNCQLLSWPVARATPAGVCTADGVEHRLDMLIVA